MLAILKKEFRLFFGTAIGYVVLSMFLTLNGLMLWVLNSDFNILDSGFADLSLFFEITPWLFVLLIPALTMRSFSEEYSTGTFEILMTKPLPTWQLVIGKFLAVLTFLISALLPTLIYVYSLSRLAMPMGNIDIGSIAGSYLGLLFLAAAFGSIGLWISTCSKSPLVVLLLAIACLFFSYYGMELLGNEFPNQTQDLQYWGLYAHFSSISRGVLDTRDLLYFASVAFFFLTLCYLKISPSKPKQLGWMVALALGVLLFAGSKYYFRLDLTSNQRYSLSPTSTEIVQELKDPVVINVYLEGRFPPEFQRLQKEVRQLLDELKAENNRIKVFFTNPQKDLQKHLKAGMTPSRLTVKENGSVSETVLLPWATVHYRDKKELVSLLKDSNPSESQETQLNASVENLEYVFVAALKKVNSNKEKSIAVLRGNGELDDLHLYSLLKSLGKSHHLSEFTLDSVVEKPQKSLRQLNRYDLLLIAKPTERFSEAEKYVLDQFTLQGGNSLWMLDAVHAEMDSLYRTGKSLAIARDLNLDDFFFRYGARFEPNLVKDLYGAKIALASGNKGNKTVYQEFVWPYHPLVTARSLHPIAKHLGPMRLQFASSIDTLANAIRKTVLLNSSPLSKKVPAPTIIALQSLSELPNPKDYAQGNAIFGLLLEGRFQSAYKNRIKPFAYSEDILHGKPAKMVLISDGDFASNAVKKGNPLELGTNKWTQDFYDNKAFLLNAVEYLLDEQALLSLRSKTIVLPLLNKDKTHSKRLFWQLLNLCLPLLLLALFGTVFALHRKRTFGRKSR
jgi:ABC-2 type transport system permease protein